MSTKARHIPLHQLHAVTDHGVLCEDSDYFWQSVAREVGDTFVIDNFSKW